MIKERPRPKGILKNLIDVRALLGCAERLFVDLTWIPALEEVLIDAMATSESWLLWLDPVSCQEQERLSLPKGFRGAYCSAVGEDLYVVGSTGRDQGWLLRVHRPRGGTATIDAELPLDARPSRVAVHPTEPLLYVSGNSSAWCERRPDYGLVWAIDTARWQVQATIRELMGPTSHIVFGLDGRAAYVAAYSAGVTVLDAVCHAKRGNYSTGRTKRMHPRRGVAGEELWVGVEAEIQVFDTQKDQQIAMIELEDLSEVPREQRIPRIITSDFYDWLGDFTFSEDEQWAYATCHNKRRLDLIDCQAYRVVENYRLDFVPYTILYIPTTEHLWIKHYDEPWVYVLALPDR